MKITWSRFRHPRTSGDVMVEGLGNIYVDQTDIDNAAVYGGNAYVTLEVIEPLGSSKNTYQITLLEPFNPIVQEW